MTETHNASEDSVTARLAEVRQAIARTANDCGRDEASVSLVAVSKTHPVEAVLEAIAAGQRIFGENRVQEAKAKFTGLKDTHSDLELHLLGPLQTNKVREAVALFDVIQTLDRPKLAEALAEEMARSGRRPNCLIEVNTGEEPQKAGIHPADLDDFLKDCRDRLGLPIIGLMCIPPVDEEPAMHFALLEQMARRAGLGVISMGMSGDYQSAVRFGATHVRVGTAIFGQRPPVTYPTDGEAD